MRLSFHEAMPKHRRPPPAQGAKDRDLIKWPSMVVTPALVLICAWLCYVVVQTKRSHCDCDEKTDAGALRHQVKRMKWRPMTPAKIDDQVDDTGFPYRVLKAYAPKITDLGDRDVSPVRLHAKKSVKTDVKAYLVDDLLSEAESNALRHVHDQQVTQLSREHPLICFDGIETLRHHLKRLGANTRVDNSVFTKDTICTNESFSRQLKDWGLNWSHGTSFYPGENTFSRELAKRISDVIGFPDESGGPFRVVSYAPNTGYKEHTDCTLGSHKGKEDRFGTVLIYLSDVAKGGHTTFPKLGISVKPKKGRALVFNSMSRDGKCDPLALHAAQTVTKGTKYILQRWYYYQNFPGVDKRPPVPPIPKRSKNQMTVQCDEYRFGSCRWYDVWTYDVITRPYF